MKRYCTLLLFVLGCSCQQAQQESPKSFIAATIEDEVITAVRSDFRDTIFFEKKFRDTTKYYYAVLTKKQNDQLQSLVTGIQNEPQSSGFELIPGQKLYIINNGAVSFYQEDYAKQSMHYKDVDSFISMMSSGMIPTNPIKNFWDIAALPDFQKKP